MKRFLLITNLVLGLIVSARATHATVKRITEAQAVACIVGEAGNQPAAAQVAIGCVIRNRGGSSQGIYGISNPCVAKASAKTLARALAAWRESAQRDITGGAKYFGCPADADYFRKIRAVKVMTIGAITFYK
jgi:spore germination cell wall hydrolase CwlJ-like protein